ncbi:MAG TPA: GvpL/GvpF family gas vesicle protein [Terriglobales bacterium]|nr:GvpL/GvpF family gas vesicle protein [Terriglobales bacterium]
MLLLYCMALGDPGLSPPSHGVCKAAVEVAQQDSLRCFYSRHESFADSAPEKTRQDALDFHWTINHIFQQRVVIPFRFPTLMKSEEDLKTFLQKHGNIYREDLSRLGQFVQMEVRLQFEAAPAHPGAPTSGTTYLKTRFDAAQKQIESANEVRNKAKAREWKQRDASGNLRLFALVPRISAEDFRADVAASQLPPGVMIRVSGPWPPTEFVNCYPEIEAGTSPS